MIESPILALFILGFMMVLTPERLRLAGKVMAALGALYCLAYGIFDLARPALFSYTGLFVHNGFSGLIGLGCLFFGAVVSVFSIKYSDTLEKPNRYFGYIFISLSFALFTVFSANLITLLVFWGLSGLMLYLIAAMFPGASNAAKKTFIFAGGSDSVMVLGICIFGIATGSFEIYGGPGRIMLDGAPAGATVSFLCLLIAALAKAGAMPFHTWIPDFAKEVPMPVTAFLPAALDKLLGIFLLFLVCQQLFVLNTAAVVLLVVIGAATALIASYVAFAQNDMKQLLAYTTIAQVGYMILGIATGTAIGLAGAVFHMLNHALYKSTIFLTGASVENAAGTSNLNRLGGLSKHMPATFAICLVACVAASGVPPLNGFFSKWMVFQALVDRMTNVWLDPSLKIIFTLGLAAALFSSALTLAAFVKLIHSVFMGQPSESEETLSAKIKEASPYMLVPAGVSAALCVVFGLFAYSLPVNGLVIPALSGFGVFLDQPLVNLWQTGAATTLILVSLLLGAAVYFFGALKTRKDIPFTGCEKLPLEGRAPGADFYRSVTDIGIFKAFYSLVEKKVFDIYDLATKAVLGIGSALSALHTGNLRTYILWFIVGMAVILVVLVKGF